MTDPAGPHLLRTLDLDEHGRQLIASLSPQEARRLADSLAAARSDSATSLDATIDGIIAVVPRLIRGRVKRILVGR